MEVVSSGPTILSNCRHFDFRVFRVAIFAVLAWAGHSPIFHTQEDELYQKKSCSSTGSLGTARHPTPFLLCATLSVELLLTRSKNLSGKFLEPNGRARPWKAAVESCPHRKDKRRKDGNTARKKSIERSGEKEPASWSSQPQPPPSPQWTRTTTTTSRCILCIISEISK